MKYFVSSISYVTRRGAFIALVISCLALFAGNAAAITISDNFNDNVKNTAIWGADLVRGNGVLTETNQRLEYTISTPTSEDTSKWPLIGNRMLYDSDWVAQIDVFNSTNPSQNNQVNSFGIDMYHCEDSNDWLYAELYAWRGGGLTIKGFGGEFATDDVTLGFMDTGKLAGAKALTGSVQMAFDSIEKIFTVSYRVNGGAWQPFGTFGVSAGGGGANGNGDWSMTDADQFCLKVYGWSSMMSVAGGQMYGDNFLATGAVSTMPVLLQPNGGESVPAGGTYFIMWDAPASAKTFTLKYSVDNGLTWTTIATDVSGLSHNWTPVPVPSNNKRQSLVKVIGYDSLSVKLGADKSTAPFTIEVVKLESPDGGVGEVYGSGDHVPITWTTNATKATVAKVRLYYSKDAGVTWLPITSPPHIIGNPGSFDWTVPTSTVVKSKPNCKVKVELRDDSGNIVGTDSSDNYFTINLHP
jgi:hypothetical protein